MLSENLRKLRTAKSLSQAQIASSIGLATSTYSMYEQGQREPNIDTLLKISKYYGVSVDDLIGNVIDDAESLSSQELALYLLELAKERGVSLESKHDITIFKMAVKLSFDLILIKREPQ